MIVRDAYGNEHRIEDAHTQDFELELPWLGNWDNSRMHWQAKKGKKIEQKRRTREQLEELAVPPRLPCTILLRRISRGEMDDDNVPGSAKYVRDEIARWMGLRSDRVAGLRWRYGQQKTKRTGFTAIRVTIYERSEEG